MWTINFGFKKSETLIKLYKFSLESMNHRIDYVDLDSNQYTISESHSFFFFLIRGSFILPYNISIIHLISSNTFSWHLIIFIQNDDDWDKKKQEWDESVIGWRFMTFLMLVDEAWHLCAVLLAYQEKTRAGS